MTEMKYVSKAKKKKTAMRRTLGFELFQYRQSKRMTQTHVYEKTGIRQHIIDRIEIGKGDVKWGEVLVLLQFYKRNVDFSNLPA